MDSVNIGDQKQLLFDDALIAHKRSFVTTVQPPLSREGPVIIPDRPWEDRAIYPWLSVVQAADRIRMWYSSADEEFRFHLCYAESTDGRCWEKPDCGVVEYRGSRANNIVYEGHGEVCGPVFLDPSAAPEQRYKGVFPGPKRIPPGAPALTGAYSPDGIHWGWCGKERIIPWYYDTFSSALWDDRIERYVLYARDNVGWTHRRAPYYRAVNRGESVDFEDFPKPERVLEANVPDPNEGQLYNPGVIKYPFAQNAYFAFPSAFYRQDMFDVRLFTSRDGVHFDEPRDAPYLTLGQAGRFDAALIAMGGGCVRMGDEVWLYYGGFPGGHSSLPHALKEVKQPHWGGVGLMCLRLDGFVSQSASRGADLLTKPLTFAGNTLQINMNASAGGWLKVEVAEAFGQPIPGFSVSEADPLYGNGVRKTVTWRGSSDVSGLSGKAIRLRFSGERLDLYAFQFVHNP